MTHLLKQTQAPKSNFSKINFKIHKKIIVFSALRLVILSVILFSFQVISSGQLVITPNVSGNDLAGSLTGGGLTIFNVNLDCNGQSSGTFSGGNSTNIGIGSGILLTSGGANIAKGPNNNTRAGREVPGFEGEADLLKSINNNASINDRCVLEFDLIPIGDKVTFKYVFASEEYPEYVCSKYNDVFGFFVSGPGISGTYANGATNIALIPGTTLPVTINNVNPGVVGSSGNGANCTSPKGSLNFSSFYKANNQQTIQYDGFTVVLTATVDLQPCKTYHFKLAIADAGDQRYDSGVFIEAGSFNSNEILASAEVTTAKCPGVCEASINVTPSGGTPPYSFTWSNGRTTEDVSGLCAGTYTVIITDQNNCTEEKRIIVADGVDSTNPVINCPASIAVNSDPGDCGAKVSFVVTATDDCTANLVITTTDLSGDFFPVGQSVVGAKTKDASGNNVDCNFTITVTDKEAPTVTCAPTVDLSCEISPTPANTGNPSASDNCEVGPITHTDVVEAGDCPAESFITRTWRVMDIHNNETVCIQTINMVDNTPPVLTWPRDTIVACDTTSLKGTGIASAIDNCDSDPIITYSDNHISGDCEWNCIIERKWKATDNCGNVTEGIQRIEKDITDRIEDVLSLDLDGDGLTDTLVLGRNGVSLAIDPGSAECIIQWLPNNGGKPKGLIRRGNEVILANCVPGTNPIDTMGHFSNPLLAESLKLGLYLRVNPDFGKTKLADLDCEIARIVMQTLRDDDDVDALWRVVNIALANLVLQPALKELTEALSCINGPLDVCE
jgi:hypothetical protein